MILRAIEGFSEGGDEGVCSVGGAGGGGVPERDGTIRGFYGSGQPG